MKSKATYVALFFVCATLLVTAVLSFAIGETLLYFRIADAPLLGPRFTMSTAIALSVSVLIGCYTAFIYKKSRKFVEEFIVELDKVAWPSWAETKSSTMTVVVVSFIAAAILGVFDAVFSKLSAMTLLLR